MFAVCSGYGMQKLTSWKDRYHNVHSFFAPQFVEHRMRLFLFGSVGRCCVKALWQSHCHPHRLHHQNPGLVSHLSATCQPLVSHLSLSHAGLFAAKMWSLWFVFPQRRAALRPVHLCRERSSREWREQSEWAKTGDPAERQKCLEFSFPVEVVWRFGQFFFGYASVFLLLRPQEEQSSGWSTGWFSSFFSGRVDPFTRGGICTQSLLAVLKANAEKGWRSLDFDSLLRQIGNLLNRQRESAGVAWYDYDIVWHSMT